MADVFLPAYIYIYLDLYLLWLDWQEMGRREGWGGRGFKVAATALSNPSQITKPTRKQVQQSPDSGLSCSESVPDEVMWIYKD